MVQTLHLGPGWDLFTVSGVDSLSRSWLGQWNLFRIFLCLMITFSVFKLFGPLLGLVSGLTSFVIVQHDPSPLIPFLLLLIPIALLAFKPGGRFGTILTWTKNLLAFYVLLTSVVFVA